MISFMELLEGIKLAASIGIIIGVCVLAWMIFYVWKFLSIRGRNAEVQRGNHRIYRKFAKDETEEINLALYRTYEVLSRICLYVGVAGISKLFWEFDSVNVYDVGLYIFGIMITVLELLACILNIVAGRYERRQ